MTEAEQIAQLQCEKLLALAREGIVRDTAFLHSDDSPMVENIAGYPAVPLTLWHCNILRAVNSPFLPPLEMPVTDDPTELAAFLWIVNPGFIAGRSTQATEARNRFLKTCRPFFKPPSAKYRFSWRNIRYAQRAGKALARFAEVLASAREYVVEAFFDKPPSVSGGMQGPAFYSDFCHNAAQLMRNYKIGYQETQRLPLKVVYQFLKEIREHDCLKNGQQPALWNPSDAVDDKILDVLNADNPFRQRLN